MLWLVDTAVAVAVFIVNIDAADDAPTAVLFFFKRVSNDALSKKTSQRPPLRISQPA